MAPPAEPREGLDQVLPRSLQKEPAPSASQFRAPNPWNRETAVFRGSKSPGIGRPRRLMQSDTKGKDFWEKQDLNELKQADDLTPESWISKLWECGAAVGLVRRWDRLTGCTAHADRGTAIARPR